MRRTTAVAVLAIVLPTCILLAEQRKPIPPAVVEDGISVYFSPKGGCEAAIVEQIAGAKKTIDMQAYSFTSAPIGEALIEAKKRGVKVRVILDLKSSKEEFREPQRIASQGVETYTDGDHPIAHNKVILIDAETILTGSFNFTKQAENSNAENLLVITGKPKLASAYESNFELHLKHSVAFKG